MNETEEIARALGMVQVNGRHRIEDGTPGWYIRNEWICRSGHWEDWLASAEGEKAVRDRCYELCVELGYRMVHIYAPQNAKADAAHALFIRKVENDSADGVWHSDSEGVVRQAALLWLVKE